MICTQPGTELIGTKALLAKIGVNRSRLAESPSILPTRRSGPRKPPRQSVIVDTLGGTSEFSATEGRQPGRYPLVG